MKVKVTKFLENAAEILSCVIVGNIFTKSAQYAEILPPNYQEHITFTSLCISALGGFFGLAIAKDHIAKLKAQQTEDSFFQFQNNEPKKPKIK
jgi:hypothetical protein